MDMEIDERERGSVWMLGPGWCGVLFVIVFGATLLGRWIILYICFCVGSKIHRSPLNLCGNVDLRTSKMLWRPNLRSLATVKYIFDVVTTFDQSSQ